MELKPTAIDQAFQKFDTPVGPVYFVKRRGWKRRTFTRKTALNNLAYFMVVDVFLMFGWPLHYADIPLGPGRVQRGDLIVECCEAHKRCVRRLRRILAHKSEIHKWHSRWVVTHERHAKERDELMKQKPY